MKKISLAFCLILIFADILIAGNHPNIFLNQNEIEVIKAKVSAGKDPWKTNYSKIISEANSALNQSPLSVTKSGINSHDYYTMKPYNWSNNMHSPCGDTCCDGLVNPKADRADYKASIKFGKAIRALGLGYAFVGDKKYADKAIALINVWCLDAGTYMTPKLFSSQGIEQFITFPGVFYGADLIYNYPGWDATKKTAFLKWVKRFGVSVSKVSYSNNVEDWRQVFVASAGVLCDDIALQSHAFNAFKSELSSHIGSKGQMTKELARTNSLEYSTYSLLAMTEVAEIAKHQGINLYGYTVSGRNLELAWDYHVPYVLNPSSWPKEQISSYKGANCALYELAYAQKQKSTYMQVMNKYGRPMYEDRTMGPVTFTHSAGLEVIPVD